jgi:putative ABC transport system permease protein
MKLRDFRVGARLLAQDPGYSLVAIFGLGVALAVSLLLFGYARHCFTYNSHVPHAERVFVVKLRKNLDVGEPWFDLGAVALRIKASHSAGVDLASGYANWLPVTIRNGAEARKLRSLVVQPGFAEMLGIAAVSGDLEDALASADAFALTESAALRVFGTTDVVGRSFPLSTVENMKCSARVAALLPDPPANSTIPYELLHGSALCLVPQLLRHELTTGEFGWPSQVLVRVSPGASLEEVTRILQEETDRSPYVRNLPPEMIAKLNGRKAVDVKLAPLLDAYFDHEVQYMTFSVHKERGNRALVLGLLAVAVLLLALASFNYVNLATIRMIRRQREIGMRKALGAGRRQLLLQFVAESELVALTALMIGIALACAALPVFGSLMNHDLSGLLTPGNIVAAFGLGGLVGLLTSIYPAWIAFGVRPARVLAGRADTESLPARRLRTALSVVQVAAAMALTSFGLAVYWQTRFAQNVSPGFDPDPLLVFEINEGVPIGATPESRGLFAELAQQPEIAGVTLSSDAVGSAKNKWTATVKREGQPGVRMDVKSVTPTFFEQYGIQPLAGRLFNGSDREDDKIPAVLNEIAAQELGFVPAQTAIGASVVILADDNRATTKRVVGIAPAIRFYSLREPPAGIVYELWAGAGATATVRASGSVADAERAVRAIWPKHYPDMELNVQSARSIYAANYANDARVARLFAVATAIALVIAFFGAYVIAADTVQRRTREIVLRKLYGARSADITRLVARELGIQIAFAALIGLPVAALAIARYLAPFVERTPLAYPALALAFVAAVATVALAGARHVRAAVRLRPATALRSGS